MDGFAEAESKEDLRQQIETAILEGRLKPGDRLRTEREFAQLSHLSRSSVRDVLGDLARAGRIVRRVGRGTFVIDGEATPSPCCPSPGELLEMRLVLEPSLASLIVLKASDEELEEIRKIVVRGRGADSWQTCEHWDHEFHRRLYLAARNDLFRRIANEISAVRRSGAWLRLKERSFSLERWQGYQHDHEEIIEALLSRDTDGAREALKRHLTGVRHKMLA